jgi:pilus assembly protein CpaC
MRSELIRRPAGVIAGAVAGALTLLVLAFGPAPAVAQDAGSNAYEVVVAVGKSQVLQLPEAYSDVMVADPHVADILPLTTRSIYIVGKAPGSTALTIYGPGKRLLAAVDVDVSADIEGLKTRMHDILPNERNVAVRPANQSLVLSGTVSSPAALHQLMTLAETYAPGRVVNMLTVEGAQQIMLSVRFVEMERRTAKNLGINVSSDAINPSPPPGNPTQHGNPGIAIAASDILTAVPGAWALAGNYRWGPHSDISIIINALEGRGLTKTLAEPNLTTMSGETANFLAGGEFPIPVQQAGSATGAITIEFQQFGISLAFTPTLLQDGLINMIVNPEVSSIDRSVSAAGVPGLKIRRAHATVELRDGESFTIAGLLSDNYTDDVNQLPWAGDIPILGTLFRSSDFQRDQTELVIVVTPHLVAPQKAYVATPTDHFIPPSDFELFLLGQMTGEAENVRPEDRALLQADPTQGGIEGPHGHVLY